MRRRNLALGLAAIVRNVDGRSRTWAMQAAPHALSAESAANAPTPTGWRAPGFRKVSRVAAAAFSVAARARRRCRLRRAVRRARLPQRRARRRLRCFSLASQPHLACPARLPGAAPTLRIHPACAAWRLARGFADLLRLRRLEFLNRRPPGPSASYPASVISHLLTQFANRRKILMR